MESDKNNLKEVTFKVKRPIDDPPFTGIVGYIVNTMRRLNQK